MKKIILVNIGTLISLSFIAYIVYFLLLKDNSFHTSISYFIANSNHFKHLIHLLLLGLLPVYISLVIFGAALVGLGIGHVIENLCIRLIKKHKINYKKTYIRNNPYFL